MNALPDTINRTRQLILSLDEFEPMDLPNYQVANLFNGLVDAAKSEMPDDPSVSGLTHAGIKAHSSMMNAGSMRTVLAQIMVAKGIDPPPTRMPRQRGITDDLAEKVW